MVEAIRRQWRVLGARVAMMFAEDCGILTGANQPYDITVGELALIFANADRVFDAAA